MGKFSSCGLTYGTRGGAVADEAAMSYRDYQKVFIHTFFLREIFKLLGFPSDFEGSFCAFARCFVSIFVEKYLFFVKWQRFFDVDLDSENRVFVCGVLVQNAVTSS